MQALAACSSDAVQSEHPPDWQAHDLGHLVLYVRPRSQAARDVDELGRRYAEALATVSDALAVDAEALPSIAVYVADLPEGEPGLLSDAAEAVALGQPPELPASELTVRTVHGIEAPDRAIEAELAHALLAHDLGPATPSARFWDEGLADYLAGRSGRSAYHAEATDHCRQLLADGILPPVGELIAESGDRVSALASTTATALAEFLIARHGLPQYQRLLREARADEVEAFEAVYRMPLALADRDWRRALEASGDQTEPALWATLRRLLPMVRPYWPAGLVIFACTLIGITFSIALPLSFRFLIDNVLGRRPLPQPIPFLASAGYVISPGQEQLDALVALLTTLGVLYLLNAGARVCLNMVLETVGESFALTLRRRLVDRLGRPPAAYYARTSSVDVAQRVVQDTSAVQQVITRAAVPFFAATLSTVVFASILLMLEPKLALVALLGLPFLALITGVRRRGRRSAARERVRRLSDLSASVSESAAAHLLVKLYGSGSYFADRLVRRMKVHRQLNIAFGRESVLLGQAGALTLGLTQVAVLLTGGFLIVVSEGQDLAPGGLVAFYLLLNQMLGPIGQAAAASQNIAGSSAGVERVAALLRESVETDPKDTIDVEPLRERIRLDGVTFGYPGGRTILTDLSLDIPAGTTVAFVGPTGAGKSSVLHLLPRLYEPTRGAITWDGVDLRQPSLASLRRHVVLVPQESVLLSTTIYENIRLGMEGVTDEDVRRAASLAAADEFISEMPLGYDTVVGERGVGLSGGQRQRIALARALLREPSVLVLDEATRRWMRRPSARSRTACGPACRAARS